MTTPTTPQPSVGRPVPRWLTVWSEISIRSLALLLGAVVAGWLFLYFAVVTLPVFIALLATAILEPLVRRLRDRGLHNMLATWIVLAGVIALFAGLVALLAPAISDQFGELGPKVDEGITEIEDWLEDGPLGIENADLRQIFERGAKQLSSGGSSGKSAIKGVSIAGQMIAGFLLTLMMVFFFLKDGRLIVGWARRHIPPHRLALADGVGRRAWATIGAYIRGTAVIGLVDGALIGIGCAVIGVPLALPLAILTFFGAFFPLLGAVSAGAIAALVALVANGPADALLVVALVLVVQEIEGDVLSPLVMGKALKLHPLVILVALTGGVVLAGVVGAFLAVPFTALAVAVGIEVKADRDGTGGATYDDDGPGPEPETDESDRGVSL